MNAEQLFKQVKNGRDIWLYYRHSDDKLYKINVRFKQSYFFVYSYYYMGNDEWDPEEQIDLKDNHCEKFETFSEMTKYLDEKFPRWTEVLT